MRSGTGCTVSDIGIISGINTRPGPERTVRKESAEGAVTQPRVNTGVAPLPQQRISLETAIREVVRGVTDYIVSSRLTHHDTYQAYHVEFLSDMPLAQMPGDEMGLMEDLCAAVAAGAARNPVDILRVQLGLSGTFLVGRSLLTVSRNDTLEQILGKMSERLTGLPVLADALRVPGEPAASPREPVQTFVVTWKPNAGVMQTTGEILDRPAVTGNRFQANGFQINESSENGLINAGKGPFSSLSSVRMQMPRAGGMGLSPTPAVGATVSTDGMQQAVSADTVTVRAAEEATGPLIKTSGEGAVPLDELRVDLRGVAVRPITELRVRYDAATIVNQVAVLSEQINGLLRILDEQAKGLQRFQQKSSPNISLLLRQALAAALSSAVEDNAALTRPALTGITLGRDGLLTLDLNALKGALQTNREEATAVIRSLANSVYDQMSLYVDPRFLVDPRDAVGRTRTEKIGRRGKDAERRWQKEKEQLEKRSRDLEVLLEDSGKLRTWFMHKVEELRLPPSEEAEIEDEVIKRHLPAVDLVWDQDEAMPVRALPDEEKALVDAFIAMTRRALKEEHIDACIGALIERKASSDRLMSSENPPLDMGAAMICLANEELLLERLESGRRKIFEDLEELSRTVVATRGYRSQFPFPPPMAAFVASEG